MTKTLSSSVPSSPTAATKKAVNAALQLRTVRHKHAPEVLKLCKTIIDAAKKMMEVEAQMTTESIAIAGARYEEDHTVLFQPFADDVNAQVQDNGELLGLPFREIVSYVSKVCNDAQEVASAEEPLPLPSEREEDE